MSTLLGFTWVFGIVAAFADVIAISYIYVILNSLQGVYIFVAFACNKRVFQLWRDTCRNTPCASLSLPWPRSSSSSDGVKSSQFPNTASSANSTTTSKPKEMGEATYTGEGISMAESSGNILQVDKDKFEGHDRGPSAIDILEDTAWEGPWVLKHLFIFSFFLSWLWFWPTSLFLPSFR